MVDIDIGCGSPNASVIRTDPSAAGSCTCCILDNGSSITLQYNLAGVASARLSDPVGEKIARVASLRTLSFDCQACKEGLGSGSSWDLLNVSKQKTKETMRLTYSRGSTLYKLGWSREGQCWEQSEDESELHDDGLSKRIGDGRRESEENLRWMEKMAGLL